MSRFNNEIKSYLKKINNNEIKPLETAALINLCTNKVSEFQLYSLALKYYSYLERNRDVEDTEDDCYHDDCKHENKIKGNGLTELKVIFDDYVEHFSKTGQLPTVNTLLELREDLKKYVTVLSAYGDQIILLENVYFKSRYNDEKMTVMDSDTGFTQRVMDILMANDNSAEIREHLKVIYPELPMRMTKSKFLALVDDYINKLKGMPTEDVKNHIQLLKETFDPVSVEGYGEVACEIALELERVKKELINGENPQKDSGYHHMYHLTEDKNNMIELALDLTELLNNVLALALVDFDSEGFRVYNVVKPLLEGESSELILAKVFEDVEQNYEHIGNDLLKISSVMDQLMKCSELIEEAGKTLEFNEFKYAFELSKEGYFIERPYTREEAFPVHSELILMKNELISYMQQVLNVETRSIRRGRMSLMMGVLQILHTTGQEIYDHIYNSISTCDKNGEKVMSMQNIYNYLNDFID